MKKVLLTESLSAKPGSAPVQPTDPEGITVTEAAAAEVKKQSEKRGMSQPVIRIGIRGGGCTGFSYLFDWEDGEPRPTDRVFRAHGVAVYVDPKSLKLLKGMELDFSKSLM